MRSSLSMPVRRLVNGSFQARRGYAAAASSSGVKVFPQLTGKTDSGVNVASYKGASHQPGVGRITVALTGGPRFEPKIGNAHALQESLLKDSAERIHLRLVREAETLGARLSTSISRENIFVNAEFNAADAPYFAQILGEAVAVPKLYPYEFDEQVVPLLAEKYEELIHSPKAYAFEILHGAVFKGLGHSTVASPGAPLTDEDVRSYHASILSNASNVSVVGGNVEEAILAESFAPAVTSATGTLSATNPAPLSYSPSSFTPKELHLISTVANVPHAAVLAYPGASFFEVEKSVALLVATELLGTGEALTKWNRGASRYPAVPGAPQAFAKSYSDAGLFGFAVEAETEEDFAFAIQLGVTGIKELSAKPISAEALTRAKKQAIRKTAELYEGPAALPFIASQVAASGLGYLAPEKYIAAIDALTPESLASTLKSVTKETPAYVTVSTTRAAPELAALK